MKLFCDDLVSSLDKQIEHIIGYLNVQITVVSYLKAEFN